MCFAANESTNLPRFSLFSENDLTHIALEIPTSHTASSSHYITQIVCLLLFLIIIITITLIVKTSFNWSFFIRNVERRRHIIPIKL